ncbi:MAG TPA: hypothetical protein VHR47_07365, partial [Bacillota bacterium]|nr:hypothetical protein [Bacillota bacterium]
LFGGFTRKPFHSIAKRDMSLRVNLFLVARWQKNANSIMGQIVANNGLIFNEIYKKELSVFRYIDKVVGRNGQSSSNRGPRDAPRRVSTNSLTVFYDWRFSTLHQSAGNKRLTGGKSHA